LISEELETLVDAVFAELAALGYAPVKRRRFKTVSGVSSVRLSIELSSIWI